MSFTTSVDPGYMGPTLLDLIPILRDIPDPIDVRWEGGPEEIQAYLTHSNRDYRLIVPSPEVADKTAWVLAGPLMVDPAELEAARKALSHRSAGSAWRTTAEDLGPSRSLLLLTKIVGDSLRAGNHPRNAASVACACLQGGVSPVDADILIRLQTTRR